MNLCKILKSDKPIVFLDLETTGLNVYEDRIVELALIRYNLDGTEDVYETLVNPGMNIPEEASKIHGISDDDVVNIAEFDVIGKEVIDFIGDSHLAGWNINSYDFPLLVNEFLRHNLNFDFTSRKTIDGKVIFSRIQNHSLKTASRFYLGLEHLKAHEAMSDTEMTAKIFMKQLEVHSNLPNTVEELDLFCKYDRDRVDFGNKFYKKEGKIYYNFGKNKGMEAISDKKYLHWIANISDMPQDVKLIAQKLLNGENV